MVSEKDFLGKMGFYDNPFSKVTAESEERLPEYFISPPYFDTVFGNPENPNPSVIFAPRGGGKSAHRKMLEFSSIGQNYLCVTYDDFDLESVTLPVNLDYHLRNIIRLILDELLKKISLLKKDDLNKKLKDADQEIIRVLCHMYLPKIQPSDINSGYGQVIRWSDHLENLWKRHTGSITPEIQMIFQLLGRDVKIEKQNSRESRFLGNSVKQHFEYLVNVVLSLKYQYIYILFDKVDEIPLTRESPESTFDFIKPLFHEYSIIEREKLGFKFFLWDTLKPYHDRPKRIRPFEMEWSEMKLRLQLSSRLKAFSDDRIDSMIHVVEPGDWNIDELIAIFAEGSPRNMVLICHSILAEQLEQDPQVSRFTQTAVRAGINKYVVSLAIGEAIASDQISNDSLVELQQLNVSTFTYQTLVQELLYSEAEAQKRIEHWLQSRLIEKIGTLHTEEGAIIPHYGINSICLVRYLFLNMPLEFFLRSKLGFCPSCNRRYIRDYDTDANHLCNKGHMLKI